MSFPATSRAQFLALTAVLLLLASLGTMLIGAEPARAKSCAEATGSDHDSLIKADNTAVDATGWNCAYVFTTGNDEIAGFATEIQESATGLGYQKVFDCNYQTGDVGIIGPTVVDGGGTLGSSATWSATNGSTGSRHYVVAALWNTTSNTRYPYAGQYNNASGCTNYDIPFNEVYTTSIDWSYTSAANGQVPTGTPWPFTVTLKPSSGKVISNDTVYMKASFRDDTTADDTIVGMGTLKNNIATVNITLKNPATVKLWPVYGGVKYKTTVPPSLGTTPVDGSCLGGSGCPGGSVVRPVVFANNPAYTATFTMSIATTSAPANTSADAKFSLTIPAGAAQVGTLGGNTVATVVLHRSVDDTPNPATDPVVMTEYWDNITSPVTYNWDEWFKLPSTPGTYRYYATFSGYGASPSTAYNGVNSVSTLPVAVTVTAAQASCSSMTGGKTNTYIKANNTYTDSRGYNCAYLDDTGPVTVASRKSVTFNFTSASQYQMTAHCETPTNQQTIYSGGMPATIVDGKGTSPTTYTWSMDNTNTSKSYTAYSSVLWMLRTNSSSPYPGQYNGTNCNSTVSGYPVIIQPNLLHMMSATLGKPTGSVATGATSTWPVTLSSIDNYVVNGGTVNVMQMQGAVPSSADSVVGTSTVTNNAASVSVKPGAGPLNFYAVLVGSNYLTPTLPSTGWTQAQSPPVNASGGAVTPAAAQAAAIRGVHRVDATATMLPSPKALDGIDVARYANMKASRDAAMRDRIIDSLLPTQVYVVEDEGTKDISASCPKGLAMYTFATSATAKTYGPRDYALSSNQRGISLRAKSGVPTRLQVTCRPIASPMVIEGTLGRGSIKADNMTATRSGSIFTGGPGDDVMVSKAGRTALDGGLGADMLRVLGSGSSANGGFGADRLYGDGDGVLLVGAQGRDTFITGKAKVLVNARDGGGGDTVTCGSSATRIAIDRGDVVNGPCTIVR